MNYDVLIADDNEDLRESIAEALQKKSLSCFSAADGEAALQAVRNNNFTVALVDLKMPKKTGIEILQEIKSLNPRTQVVLMTAFGSVESAIQALRLEAADYLLKPFSLADLEQHVEDLLKRYQLQKTEITPSIRKKNHFVGESASIRRVQQLIKKVAPTTTPVLILGESGTGKEVVAKEIHRQSSRTHKPFIAINCAALSEGVLESELFGHQKGAFTGAYAQKKGLLEAADGGTLFLDEIAEIPTSLQVKLLRFLQEQEFQRVGGTETINVNVRLIAATNRNLAQEVKDKRFREDLFYRLNVFEIHTPPLRERKEDIPLLVDHFLNQQSASLRLSEEAMEAVMRYDWPGNIRQLENALERASVLAENGMIQVNDLPSKVIGSDTREEALFMPQNALTSPPLNQESLIQLEKEMLLKTLQENNWNQSKTAKKLGIKRATLQYRMQKYGFSKEKEKPHIH